MRLLLLLFLLPFAHPYGLYLPSSSPPLPLSSYSTELTKLFLDTQPLLPLKFNQGTAVTWIHTSNNSSIQIIDKIEDFNSNLNPKTTAITLNPRIWAKILSPKFNATITKTPSASYPHIYTTKGSSKKPTLIFLHGSFHSPSCYLKHWVPFFCSRGFNTICLPLRGTSEGYKPENEKKVKINEHVSDFNNFISSYPNSIIITHSFSSLILLKSLDKALVCEGLIICNPIPPEGNGPMTLRFLKRSLVKSYKITVGLALKKVMKDPEIAKFCFFDDDIEEVEEWMKGFERDSKYTIDLKDLAGNLPSKIPPPNLTKIPSLVIGSYNDNLVDKEAILETCKFLNADSKFIESPHDIMLGRRWENGGYEILEWLNNNLDER